MISANGFVNAEGPNDSVIFASQIYVTVNRSWTTARPCQLSVTPTPRK
jgi:hypothetical protein